MNDIEELIASCRDGNQADELIKDKNELERARKVMERMKDDVR